MKRIVCILIAAGFLVALAFTGLSFWRFTSTTHLIEPISVVIAAGTGKKAVLKQLHAAQIAPPWWLASLPLMLSSTTSLKAGEYYFEGSISAADALQKIARGEVVVHKITLPEGWNARQLATALNAEPTLTGELPAMTEGAYLPETYHFTRGEARSAVLARMQKAMDDTLAQAWQNRTANTATHSASELLILASIIERETGVSSERPLVASVYSNRLRMNMPLQADPTVAYGIEYAQGAAMNRPLTRGDLQRDHAWNTYTRTGLPATPIACAGKASIIAAARPPTSEFLYFVADGKGGHVFAKTLAEHNRNVAAYRATMKKISVP